VSVLYVIRSDGKDARTTKECNSLRRAGYEVTLVGWSRAGEAHPGEHLSGIPALMYAAPAPERRRGALAQMGGTMAQWGGFLQHVLRAVQSVRPDVIHAVNEELALLSLLLRGISGHRVVCDVFDSVALKWSAHAVPISAAARTVSYLAHRFSDVLIVTDERRRGRLGRFAEKAVVVGNYPVDVGSCVADRLPDGDGPIKLYVSGALYDARGLKMLLDLLERRDDVRIVSAGWVYDAVAERFVAHEAVDFRGVVTPEESLRMAAGCHAVVALYKPSTQNNVLASPNKLYDALCIGRPIIINRETSVSQWVDEQDVGYLVTYGNAAELDRLVSRLKENVTQMDVRARYLREVFTQGYSWEVAERALLDAYATLC
jgi:glycosyltransferase involved in cell wall biosynthesis